MIPAAVAATSGAAAGKIVAQALVQITGVNNSHIQISKKDSRKRKQRLEANKRRGLFHQTNADATEKIIQSNKMLRGKDGIAGGGIYFADSVENTLHKAHNMGFVFEARVKLAEAAGARMVEYKHRIDDLVTEASSALPGSLQSMLMDGPSI